MVLPLSATKDRLQNKKRLFPSNKITLMVKCMLLDKINIEEGEVLKICIKMTANAFFKIMNFSYEPLKWANNPILC
jgi:hypothetical protein